MDNRKLILSQPLSPHFLDNGRPAIPLSALQQQARDEIVAKLAGHLYRLVVVDCPLCGSSQRQLLSEKDSAGLPIQTSLCLSCGIIYASRRLDDRSLAGFYADENLRLDRGVESGESVLFRGEKVQGAHIAKFLSDRGLLEPLRGSLLVEIGCGPGGILAYFQDLGFEVVGFDIDLGVVAYGQSQGVELHHGGIDVARHVLAAKNSRPGLLIYSQALEHMTNPLRELEGAKSIMRPDTLLFVGVPGLRNLGPHYRYDFLNFLQPGHLIHFEQTTLSRLLESLGFVALFADEVIDGVFRQAPVGAKTSTHLTNPANSMLAFLAKAERKRSRIAAIKAMRSAAGRYLRPLINFLRRDRSDT